MQNRILIPVDGSESAADDDHIVSSLQDLQEMGQIGHILFDGKDISPLHARDRRDKWQRTGSQDQFFIIVFGAVFGNHGFGLPVYANGFIDDDADPYPPPGGYTTSQMKQVLNDALALVCGE